MEISIVKKSTLLDRGFYLGDGVFTTMKCLKGEILFLEEHLQRLKKDAKAFGMDADIKQIQIAIQKTASLQKSAIIRITLSRTSSRRGISIKGDENIKVDILISPLPAIQKEIKATISPYKKFSQPPLSQIKHLGYQLPILAKRDAQAQGYDDALLLNENNNLSCATTGNIFVMIHHEWITPPLNDGVLPGVTRALILKNMPIKIQSIPQEDIENTEEAFITNSVVGIQSIIQLNQKKLYKKYTQAILEKFKSFLAL